MLETISFSPYRDNVATYENSEQGRQRKIDENICLARNAEILITLSWPEREKSKCGYEMVDRRAMNESIHLGSRTMGLGLYSNHRLKNDWRARSL